MVIEKIIGDCFDVLPTIDSESIDCVVTSPPYWGLRDYGGADQIGMERTPEDYVDSLVRVFSEVHRVLKNEGTLWLNIGDCYAGGSYSGNNDRNIKVRGRENLKGTPKKNWRGLPPKNLIGIPWRVALALQNDGWILRSDIIWSKPNPMPEPVKDRPVRAHEYIFLFSKSRKYYYDCDSIREPYTTKGYQLANPARKNKRTVWNIPPKGNGSGHCAVFPPKLIEPCIKAGSPKGGVVLDPFYGSGTTGFVANALGRDCIGIEINPD